jgi:hypothetical protein
MAVSRNTVTTVAAIKLGIFVLASVIVTGTLTAIMGSFSFGSQSEYKAVFSSASLLAKGDDVRVAGVTVGEVTGVEIKDRTDAEVTFKVKGDVPVTKSSRGWHHSEVADPARPEPHRALQRVPAALPGAPARRDQRPLDEPHPGAPGRGRHGRGADEPHRLADQHAGRP